MVIEKACLLIPQMNTKILPIMFTIESAVINKISRHNPITFIHVSYNVYSLKLT